MNNFIKLLLLPQKLKEIELLLAKNGNYGGVKLWWVDGKGSWDAEASFGWEGEILTTFVKNQDSQYTFLEAVDKILELVEKDIKNRIL